MPNSTLVNASQKLRQNHGYRFDGDFVHLNAEVDFLDTDVASGEAWALQLWASENGFGDGALAGVKVAELALQPEAGMLLANGCCAAFPPAGDNPQLLGLALVAYDGDGLPQVRDLAVYPATETFLQPRFVGKVTCEVANGQARITAESIANPRAASILSGTLALEVWALDTPYAGGSWQGAPVATAIIGVIAGGAEWQTYEVQVPASMPQADAALSLMLREWTPAGYITRDYRNISARHVNAPEIVAAQAEEIVCASDDSTPVLAEVAIPVARTAAAIEATRAAEFKKQMPAKKKKGAKSAHKPTASKRH